MPLAPAFVFDGQTIATKLTIRFRVYPRSASADVVAAKSSTIPYKEEPQQKKQHR
jgi:hypothetical protein